MRVYVWFVIIDFRIFFSGPQRKNHALKLFAGVIILILQMQKLDWTSISCVVVGYTRMLTTACSLCMVDVLMHMCCAGT